MKIKKMTDEQCLGKFIEMLDERVSINTGFVRDDEKDIFTHQVVQITCGDLVSTSQPMPLAMPMRPATVEEMGETLN